MPQILSEVLHKQQNRFGKCCRGDILISATADKIPVRLFCAALVSKANFSLRPERLQFHLSVSTHSVHTSLSAELTQNNITTGALKTEHTTTATNNNNNIHAVHEGLESDQTI